MTQAASSTLTLLLGVMCPRLSLVSPCALRPHSVRIVQEEPKARVVNTERWNQVCSRVVLVPNTLDKVLV